MSFSVGSEPEIGDVEVLVVFDLEQEVNRITPTTRKHKTDPNIFLFM
jgi:hypothetical protein